MKRIKSILFEEIAKPIKDLDKRFKVLLASIGLFDWANSFTAGYNQLYAVSLGANPVELGTLSGMGGIVSSTISVPAGWLIDRYGIKRILITGLLMSILVSVIYGFANHWLMLVPAVMLAQVSFRLIIPLADLVFISTSEPGKRTRLMGLSRTVWSIAALLAPMMAAVVVTAYGGITVEGMRPLYFIQLLTIVAMTLFIVLTLEELDVHRHGEGVEGLREMSFSESFRDLFRGESDLKKWIILMSLWRLGMSFSMPFIPLWMVYAKGADPYILGAVSTVGLLVPALLQVPMGAIADKFGRKKTFLIIRPITYVGTFVLITAPNAQTLVLVGLLGALGFIGGFASLSFVPFITMFWEAVPTEKRGRWFGLTGVFEAISVPGFLVAGFLWNEGLKELVLVLPLVMELLLIVPLLLTIPDRVDLKRR